MGYLTRQLAGPTDPTKDASWGQQAQERRGFFTDTSICIGCKACEVACKEWNAIPESGMELLGSSYDNTGALGANNWRHVAFVEQGAERIAHARETGARLAQAVDLGMPTVGPPPEVAQIPPEVAQIPAEGAQTDRGGEPDLPDFRWLMDSDVCKHCTHAGCLDVCPTGALFRTEFGTVVVQDDVCNGCGYCVAACPFGVIERRPESPSVTNSGVAQKCTLCYDRLGHDQTPACAQACPTTSIKFGTHDEMVQLATERVTQLHEQGLTEARLYGANEHDGVGGTGSVFLLLDDPEVYGLPPDPEVPTAKLAEAFRHAGFAALGFAAAAAVAAIAGGRL